MIPIASGARVWLATGHTDTRRGINALSLMVQETLGRDAYSGDLYVFRGRRGDLIKVLWHDALGASLDIKRLERGAFAWPRLSEPGGTITLTPAQLAMLIEGIDWRTPEKVWQPAKAG